MEEVVSKNVTRSNFHQTRAHQSHDRDRSPPLEGTFRHVPTFLPFDRVRAFQRCTRLNEKLYRSRRYRRAYAGRGGINEIITGVIEKYRNPAFNFRCQVLSNTKLLASNKFTRSNALSRYIYQLCRSITSCPTDH